MINFSLKQIISIFLILILVLNLVLFALRKINVIYFWIIIGIIAVIAYYVIPKMK
jgi:hypothetical protein